MTFGQPTGALPMSTCLRSQGFQLHVTLPSRHKRPETLALVRNPTGAAADTYARQKENHSLQPSALRKGLVTCVPMVAEATGLWKTGAAPMLRPMAAAAAGRSGDPADIASLTLLQKPFVVIRSFRARAVLWKRTEAAAE